MHDKFSTERPSRDVQPPSLNKDQLGGGEGTFAAVDQQQRKLNIEYDIIDSQEYQLDNNYKKFKENSNDLGSFDTFFK